MPLFKHHPEITLLLPRELQPGAAVSAKVVVTTRRELTISALCITIEGRERVSADVSGARFNVSRVLLNLAARLSRERTLSAGRTELPFRFELPPKLPPTYSGRHCAVDYRATVCVSIPWWSDTTASFDLYVCPPRGVVVEEPVVFSSDPGGPRAREAHVEGSLTSKVFAPGGVVAGALALNNVLYNNYGGVEVGLVAMETVTLRGVTRSRAETARYQLEIPVSRFEEGGRLPFSFRLPEQIQPSYGSKLWQLSWAFFLRARVRWRSDLRFRVPVTVISAPSPSRKPEGAPPSVGSERVEQIWRSVARELDLRSEPGRLRGEVGEVGIDIVREHRGRQGVFLVARLSYPRLELGLGIEPESSRLDRLIHSDIQRPAGWDGRYRLRGRDLDQVAAFARPLRPFADEVHALYFDDHEARVEHRDAGQRHKTLREFVLLVRRLAVAIDTARGEIPPPAVMAAGLESWHRLAQRLGGPLELASMSVRGHFLAVPAEVVTEWSAEGHPERTRLTTRHNAMLPAERELHLMLPGPGGSLTVEQLPESASVTSEVLVEILRDAYTFELNSEHARLSLAAPLLDPLPLLGRFALIARLIESMRVGQGPFR